MPVSASSWSFWVTPIRSSGQSSGRRRRERVAVERDRDHPGAAGRGIHPGALEHRPVSGVDAVELADRDDRRAEAGGDLGRVAEDDHAPPRRTRHPPRGVTGGCVASHHNPKNGSTSGTKRYPMPNNDHTVGCAKRSGRTKAERADDEHADELEPDRDPRDDVPGARAGEDQRERRDDVDDRRHGGERVGQRRLVELLDDLHEGAAGGGERHDPVDDHEDAADAGHPAGTGRREDIADDLSLWGWSPWAMAGASPWARGVDSGELTVQITCIRHTMTAMASAATPMMTVLQRLRSSERPPDRRGRQQRGRDEVDPELERLPVGGLPTKGATIATTTWASRSSSTSASDPTVEIARATSGEPQHHAQQTGRDGHDDLRQREPQDHRAASSGMFIALLRSSPRCSTMPTREPSGSIAAAGSPPAGAAAPAIACRAGGPAPPPR